MTVSYSVAWYIAEGHCNRLRVLLLFVDLCVPFQKADYILHSVCYLRQFLLDKFWLRIFNEPSCHLDNDDDDDTELVDDCILYIYLCIYMYIYKTVNCINVCVWLKNDFWKQYFIFSIKLRQAVKMEISFTD